jgi:hypothetical protein
MTALAEFCCSFVNGENYNTFYVDGILTSLIDFIIFTGEHAICVQEFQKHY